MNYHPKVKALSGALALMTLMLCHSYCLGGPSADTRAIEDIISGKTVTPLSKITGNRIPRSIPPPITGRRETVGPTRLGVLPEDSINQRQLETCDPAELIVPATSPNKGRLQPRPAAKSLRELLDRSLLGESDGESKGIKKPRVNAKAIFCVDNSCNKVVLAKNVTEPLPIASITKLLTAMTVIDTMNLKRVVRIPDDIRKVPRHRVGIRPGDLMTVEELLHGMLIESGNDCAEALARAYPKGRDAFLEKMNKRAKIIGATKTKIYTPSGLDRTALLGRKDGRELLSKHPNVASAQDVALIAKRAFEYPHIRRISKMKPYKFKTRNKRPRTYVLRTNDRLLHRPLPVEGAKTGYTNLAGRCIVALFKDDKRDYTVVVLNTKKHFKEAEKIYRWVCKTF